MRGVPPGGVADRRVPAGAGCCANAGDAADNSRATTAMALSDFAVMVVPLRFPRLPAVSVPHGDPPVNHGRRVSSGRETFYKPFMADPASDPLAWRQLKAPSLVE